MKAQSFYTTIIALIFFIISATCSAQTQKGQTLVGITTNNYFGVSNSMPNSNTVAVGIPNGNSGTGAAKVYIWNGISWQQKGQTMFGQNINDGFGNTIDMPDTNTLIIGIAGTSTGAVKVYRWNSGTWQQKGQIINGDSSNDCFGCSLNMPDSNTLIVGAPGVMSSAGYVKVYDWNGTNWIQKGSTFTGSTNSDRFGSSVYMSDSNTLIFGAPEATANVGNVYVYKWNGVNWIQKGATLYGSALNDLFGSSVSTSDSNTIIVGATQGGNSPGYVKVYNWDGTNWIQKGQNISGLIISTNFASSIAMPDSNTFIVSDSWADSSKGYIKIYKWNGGSWLQKGLTLYGSAPYYNFGCSISMPDSNTFAVGAFGANSNTGAVKIYSFTTTSIARNYLKNGIKLYPNPFSVQTVLETKQILKNATLSVYNVFGQKVAAIKNIVGHSAILKRGNLPEGVYLLRLTENHKIMATKKVIIAE